MEKELNIAALLKEKPKGTKLWSPISGDCKYEYLIHDSINVWFQGLGVIMLSKKGKWNPCGETIIFPSKQMQDWSKFAWKKGDVLVSEDNVHIIFEKFEDDTYTRFKGKHYFWKEFNVEDYNKEETKMLTSEFKKATDDVAQTYIKTIEEHLDGKLNLETLEIEKQLEFKDGDIVVYGKSVAICRKIYKHTLSFYVSLNEMVGLLFADEVESSEEYRFATEEEKQQLFAALDKEGKLWNPDTKQIKDLPKKCEFKPMDWCLMKDSTKYWELCQFAYTRKVHGTTFYSAVGGLIYYKCIPYNEETKHLLGTADEWKGGEE